MSPTGGGLPPEPPPKRSRRSDALYGNTLPVTTSNQFAALETLIEEDDMDIEFSGENSSLKPKPKPGLLTEASTKNTRVPPITVTGKSRSQLLEICNAVKLKSYRLKLTSTGINLCCSSIEDFKNMKALLKEKNANYFTHALAEEKEYRVILKGLFLMEQEEIIGALAEVGLKPKSIRAITPRKRKYTDQAHYVLAFSLGSIKMSTLKQCKYIAHCSVEWDFYSPRKFGPTRCHNCNMFGHGKRQCQMKTKCPVCADNHLLDMCPSIDDSGNLLQGCKFKCPNCSGEHPATFEKCPKLIEYLQIQERLAAKNSKSAKTVPRQFVPKPEDFPTMKTRFGQQPTSSVGNPSWVKATPGMNTSTDPIQNDILMSPSEIIQLTQELISSLRGCKSRGDQFNIVVNMALKFLGGHGQP